MLQKPSSCYGCALERRGFGYAPAVGPNNSKILLVGEALGSQEAVLGKPFVGQAGGMLDQILRLCGFSRDQFRIDNTIRCQPPGNWLAGAPWEHEAVEHCSQHIGATLNEQHTVVMPLGTTAAQRLLGIAPGTRNGGINNTHGTVTRDALDRFWIVPSFHPSYIQRGAHNLIGVCVHDFRLAAEIAIKGFTPVTPELTVDPSPDWFGKWVRDGLLWAEKRCVGNTLPPWLSADIETPEKAKGADEGELEAGKTKVKAVDLGTAEKPAELKDPTNVILRINFAYKQDHGITVPFAPAYMAGIRALLQSPFFSKVFWNKNYDIPRLEINGCHVAQPLHDFMDAWHVLQSDLPRGLGFVSPFYQKRPPWKHLSDENPGEYAAEDAVRTTVDAYGIEANLRELGMWDIYYRHIYKLDTLALKPAEEVGLRVFPGNVKKGTGLHGFSQELGRDKDRISDGIRENVPREIWPRKVYKTTRTFYEDDEKTKLKPEFEGRLEEFSEIVKQMHCSLCEKDGVRKGHENTKKCKGATLAIVDISVPRWNQILDFNPSSPDQMLKYIAHRGHKAGRNKKTKNPSADITALEALAKRHKKDPVYGPIMDLRKIDKMKGTYADGMLKRMDKDFRVHTTFMHKPSTLRLSSGDPSVMNLVKRGDDEETQYAKRFRECIVAEPGCVILEADYTGIEAVEVGWFSADPNYIRLASIGVHSYLCSHLLDKPADLTWEDDRLAEYLAEFKHSKDPATKAMYARSKRCVHGGNYGMTPAGMRANYPETFKTVAEATRVQDIYMAVCPKLRDWQRSIIQRANRQGYLGGDEHPFRYRHWFWNVINHKRLTRPQYLGQKVKGLQVIENDSGYWSVQYGDDAKRAIAFFPQSTAGGVLKEAMLALFDPELPETYIGDTYYGKTPFRMPIHDSLFLEVPNNKVDFVVERLVKVMTSPIKQQPCPTEWGIGQEDGLKMGVEIERGKDWSKMEEIDITQYGG